MIQRLRHRNLVLAPQGEQMDQDQQATPIYDLIAQALHKWDILGLSKFDGLVYEDTVVWLLQHLPEVHDVHSVESLMVQACTDQEGSSDFSPEQSLMLTFLAEDLWSIWTAYLHRSDKPTFYQVRIRSKMRRFYYPEKR